MNKAAAVPIFIGAICLIGWAGFGVVLLGRVTGWPLMGGSLLGGVGGFLLVYGVVMLLRGRRAGV